MENIHQSCKRPKRVDALDDHSIWKGSKADLSQVRGQRSASAYLSDFLNEQCEYPAEGDPLQNGDGWTEGEEEHVAVEHQENDVHELEAEDKCNSLDMHHSCMHQLTTWAANFTEGAP